MEGLIEYEASIGPHGVPWRVAFDDQAGTWLEVETRTDHAQAAIDIWRASNKEPEPGTQVVVVDTRPKGDNNSTEAGD